jgi:hypothetical protein
MSDLSNIQHEVEAEARRLLPDAVRRVEWLRHGDAPVIEPGELAPQFILAEPAGTHGTDARSMIKALQRAHASALKRFRHELAQRWPEIRHLGVTFEDDRGRRSGGMIQALEDEHGPDSRGIPVTVRLEPAALEALDRMITTGVAASRAEALRWALGRVGETGLRDLLVERATKLNHGGGAAGTSWGGRAGADELWRTSWADEAGGT